jgi:4'-phosphopantetheinyl transferase
VIEIGVRVELYQFAADLRAGSPSPLDQHAVHIWYAQSQPPFPELTRLASLLSADEQERASHFRFPKNRDEYVLCRGMLRTLLGFYAGIDPQQVCLQYGPHGKPEWAGSGSQRLPFNASHSDGLAICGFTEGHRIGVDVEKVRRDFATSEIAERFFSPAERDALSRVPEASRHYAFFRCWARKEAYIKALGEGLSHPLRQFDVSIEPNDARILAIRPDSSEVSRWQMKDLPLPEEYVGAVAVELSSADCGREESSL